MGVYLQRAGIALLSGWLLASSAFALPAHYSVSQLYHSQWTIRDGAPTGIEMMAQTSDGFLWLASAAGLVRFDGVQFEKMNTVSGVPLLSQNIYRLYATVDGELWIGYTYGGVSVLRDGRLTNYGQAQGLPVGGVTAFAKTADGTVWAGTSRGLFRLEQGQWRVVSPSWNVPVIYVDSLLVDRDHVLWLLEGEQVFYLRPDATRFEKLPVKVGALEMGMVLLDHERVAAFCSHEHFGVLKLEAPSGGRAFVARWDLHRGSTEIHAQCAFDREGHLWGGSTEGAGRFTLSPEGPAAATEALRRYKTDIVPLTGRYVAHILEDREGNMWFATSGGLDRFRAPALLKEPLDSGSMNFLLAPAGEHGMWAGTTLGSIYRFHDAQRERFERTDTSGISVETFYGDPSGALWIGGGASIWRLGSDRRWLRSPPPAASINTRFWNIQSMTQDASGSMWVSVRRLGVYRIDTARAGDAWVPWGGRTDLPAKHASVLFTDSRGRIWFGYIDGRVACLDGEVVTVLGGEQQAPLGPVFSFAQWRDLVWIGTDRGLWLTDGKRIQAVTGSHGSFHGVSGIAVTPQGDLWLNTADGVAHIPHAELPLTLDRPADPVHCELLNYLDGLPGGAPMSGRSLPTAAVSNDGRIWFSTDNGVAWIDPSRTPRNTVVPTVAVRSLIADGVAYVVHSDTPTQLPVHTRNLQISYTAPSLTMPERVMFRYRLGGDDARWQDVGSRREAYFTDLRPGRYHFQVIAANNDGLWNETGARVTFVIPPTFMQTHWFTALCVAAAAIVTWMLYWLRLRSVNARLRLRLEERSVERERIARELHDTFLQGVQGVILRFQAAMEQIPLNEPARALMEDALDRADRVISDGRDAVTNLRATPGMSIDLLQDLNQLGERLSQDLALAFVMDVSGKPIELDPVVRLECLRIATEALNNAFHHSRGTRVELFIGYTRRQFQIRVADNGRGFDPKQTYEGHWGLVGMRERADRLHARLRIDSTPEGSTITLEVRARFAYKRGRRSNT